MVNCWSPVEAVVVCVLSHASLEPSQERSRRVVEIFNQLRQLVDLLLTPKLLTMVLCYFIAHLSFLLFASELLRHWEEEEEVTGGEKRRGTATRDFTLDTVCWLIIFKTII